MTQPRRPRPCPGSPSAAALGSLARLLAVCCVCVVACGDDPASPGAEDGGAAATTEPGTHPSNDAASVSKRDAAALASTLDATTGQSPLPLGDAGLTPARSADSAVPTVAAAGATKPGWKLVFADEFEGTSGTAPDASKWAFETGGGGFGNNELEFYTARPENASLDGQGKLVITARAESYMGSKYTSARIKTQGKFEHTYGRYEARLRIPKGQGIWPAFWLLGADIAKNSWPACGEIDVMENIGKEPSLIHGTIHGPGYSGGNGIGKSAELPGKASFSDDFHVVAIEWEEKAVRWYLDDVLYQTRTPADLPAGAKWVYDHDFFVLLNLAVGGQWPGSPDSSTQFPQQLSVDYVRVYDRAS